MAIERQKIAAQRQVWVGVQKLVRSRAPGELFTGHCGGIWDEFTGRIKALGESGIYQPLGYPLLPESKYTGKFTLIFAQGKSV